MARHDIEEIERAVAAEGREVRRDFWQTLLSGVALTLPLFITLLVLAWVLDTVFGMLTPFVDALVALGLVEGVSVLFVHAVAVVSVLGFVLLVGFAAQHGPDTHLSRRIDVLMEDLPGVGSIYASVERMSDVLLEGDTESFREVKLVEFPHQGSYAIAFLTAESSPAVAEVTGNDDMLTVFVPMAPNPVMGGHLLTLPPERVHDIDLTVEEGMEAIMTTGITMDEYAGEEAL